MSGQKASFGSHRRTLTSSVVLVLLLVNFVSAQNFMGSDNPYNLVENETFLALDENSSISPEMNVTYSLVRKSIFDKPPAQVHDEVSNDSIIDEWEQSSSCQDI